MTGDLYRLVFHSRVRSIAERDAMRREAETLVAIGNSRSSNVITGALLFGVDGFAHVVEGPRQVLEAKFELLQRDERHENATVLAFEPISRRAFSGIRIAVLSEKQRNALLRAPGCTAAPPSQLSADQLIFILQTLTMEADATGAPGQDVAASA